MIIIVMLLELVSLSNFWTLRQRHLAYVLSEYERYFNRARPHQGISQRIPDPLLPRNLLRTGKIERRDILGGVIHDYYAAA
jgi:putative transposase